MFTPKSTHSTRVECRNWSGLSLWPIGTKQSSYDPKSRSHFQPMEAQSTRYQKRPIHIQILNNCHLQLRCLDKGTSEKETNAPSPQCKNLNVPSNIISQNFHPAPPPPQRNLLVVSLRRYKSKTWYLISEIGSWSRNANLVSFLVFPLNFYKES